MARRWTAVDRETGEIFEYSSRAAMRQAVHTNPVLRSRERVNVYEHKAGTHIPLLGPLWAEPLWSADTVNMKRERSFENATNGLRWAYLIAVTHRDAEAATRIRDGWERYVKAYGEGRLTANEYQTAMKEFTGWLFDSPYAPPIAIWYRVGKDEYDRGDDDQEDWNDADYE